MPLDPHAPPGLIIYAQPAPTAAAVITGSREGLLRLRDALNVALESEVGAGFDWFEGTAGLEYTLYIATCGDEERDQLRPPFTSAEFARASTDGLDPAELSSVMKLLGVG